MQLDKSIAIPYAKAVYSYAKESESIDIWDDMLFNLSQCICDSYISQLLNKSLCSQHEIFRIIVDILSNHLNKFGTNFLKTVSYYNRLKFIPIIYELFKSYHLQDKKIIIVKLITAYPVTERDLFLISNRIKQKKFFGNIKIVREIDNSLIGGMMLIIDDQVIDCSVKKQLEKLKHDLNNHF